MKRKFGLTACYLFALVFPPLCGLLLQRLQADWAVYYRTSSFVGYEVTRLAAMLLCGGCMALHTALSGRGGGRLWPQALVCALCGALALSANTLCANWLYVFSPSLPLWYFELDPLRLWMLFFGYFLAHALWLAWRRRWAGGGGA